MSDRQRMVAGDAELPEPGPAERGERGRGTQRAGCCGARLVEPVQPRVADEVEPVGVGDDRRVLAVREGPEPCACPGVERVGGAR